jgi:Ca2+-binding RTX toxin-like protein
MPPVLGTLTSFNATTGAFTFTPSQSATGLDLITFTVSDGTSTDTGLVRINILPRTPVVISTGGNINVTGTDGRDFVIISRATANHAQVRTDNPDTGYSATGVYVLTGTVTVSTGAGEDNINLTDMPNDSLVDAGADNDYVSGGVGNDTIIGGPGGDRVNASQGNNVVWGDVVGEQDLVAGGDDILSSLGGNDVMYGGGGNDQLYPGAGNDFVNAGQGDDLVGAAGGDDRVFGGQGNDVLSGDDGNDIISGNGGNDQIIGSSGNDLLIGGMTGTGDNLNGGGGSDLLVAGELMNGFASLVGDANDLALIALLANWNASHSPGLLSSLVAGDDGANDSLLGGEGDDDFYASVTDFVTDLNALNMGVDRRFS